MISPINNAIAGLISDVKHSAVQMMNIIMRALALTFNIKVWELLAN